MRSLNDIRLSDYDFIDLGSGDGASLIRFEQRFGGRGVGIDLNPGKVQRAQSLGRNVVVGDIADIDTDNVVRFVTMDNVLEHLPDLEAVRGVLGAAAQIASEFIYIRHPSFEDEAYLRSVGLKQFWTDWTGHTCHLLLQDYVRIFRDLGLGMMEIRYSGSAVHSSDRSLLPITAPADQKRYDEALHGPKPSFQLAKPVAKEIDILVPTHSAGNRLFLEAPTREGTDTRPNLGSVPNLSSRFDADRLTSELLALRAEVASLKRRRALRLADAYGRLRRAGSFGGRWRALVDAVRVVFRG